MVTRSHAVAGRNIQKTIPQDRNFFMRHAIMRSCEDRARLRLESTHLAVQAEADELVPARSADEVVVKAREELAEGLIVASVAAHRAPLEQQHTTK